MRVHRQAGRIDIMSVLIVLSIIGILAAVIGGNYASKRAKIERAVAIEEKWQEKSCDYFNYHAAEEMRKGDAEKTTLYHKLFSACLKLKQLEHRQPKTPE